VPCRRSSRAGASPASAPPLPAAPIARLTSPRCQLRCHAAGSSSAPGACACGACILRVRACSTVQRSRFPRRSSASRSRMSCALHARSRDLAARPLRCSKMPRSFKHVTRRAHTWAAWARVCRCNRRDLRCRCQRRRRRPGRHRHRYTLVAPMRFALERALGLFFHPALQPRGSCLRLARSARARSCLAGCRQARVLWRLRTARAWLIAPRMRRAVIRLLGLWRYGWAKAVRSQLVSAAAASSIQATLRPR